MSSLPVASQIEILDLRHFSARQLRPLLEAEAAEWQRRLRWDYRSSTELLLQYLDSRILHGFVALDQGRVCGYTFCVYEGRKAVIGDAFASGHRSMSDADATRVLLIQVLDMLRNSPAVDRVESQLLLFNAGEFAGIFAGPAFTIYPRLFLECPLRHSPSALSPEQYEPAITSSGDPAAFRAKRPEQYEVPAELELLPWTAHDYQPAGELIHACYIGHTDAEINDQYRTLHGSLRFLHNIVRFPGCGTFEAPFSWTLRERNSGSLVGMVLCSRVAPEVAHVTQLCVAPSYRGRSLGLTLLRQSADTLRRAGFDAITLTVTEANQQAVNLYTRFGFTRKHRFDAMSFNTKFPLRSFRRATQPASARTR